METRQTQRDFVYNLQIVQGYFLETKFDSLPIKLSHEDENDDLVFFAVLKARSNNRFVLLFGTNSILLDKEKSMLKYCLTVFKGRRFTYITPPNIFKIREEDRLTRQETKSVFFDTYIYSQDTRICVWTFTENWFDGEAENYQELVRLYKDYRPKTLKLKLFSFTASHKTQKATKAEQDQYIIRRDNIFTKFFSLDDHKQDHRYLLLKDCMVCIPKILRSPAFQKNELLLKSLSNIQKNLPTRHKKLDQFKTLQRIPSNDESKDNDKKELVELIARIPSDLYCSIICCKVLSVIAAQQNICLVVSPMEIQPVCDMLSISMEIVGICDRISGVRWTDSAKTTTYTQLPTQSEVLSLIQVQELKKK